MYSAQTAEPRQAGTSLLPVGPRHEVPAHSGSPPKWRTANEQDVCSGMTLEAGLATASCPGSAACAQPGVRRRGRSRHSSSRRRVRTSARAVWPTARIGKRVRCSKLRESGAGPFTEHDTRSGTIPRCLHGLHGVQRCVQLVVVSLAKFLNDSGTSTSGDTPRPSTTAPRHVYHPSSGEPQHEALPHAEIATPGLQRRR